jgi:hypothetical protein
MELAAHARGRFPDLDGLPDRATFLRKPSRLLEAIRA